MKRALCDKSVSTMKQYREWSTYPVLTFIQFKNNVEAYMFNVYNWRYPKTRQWCTRHIDDALRLSVIWCAIVEWQVSKESYTCRANYSQISRTNIAREHAFWFRRKSNKHCALLWGYGETKLAIAWEETERISVRFLVQAKISAK